MILALVLSLGVGLSLGLLGGGGSVLMVPVFVYAAGMKAKAAITLSLLVVSATSLMGAVRYFRRGFVNMRLVSIFIFFGCMGALAGARLTHLVPHNVLLVLFSALMILIGLIMFLKKESMENDEMKKCRARFVPAALISSLLGVLTGFLGVGGGFLIVPVLSWMMKCSMRAAIGTSLVIISANAIAGFAAHAVMESVDWHAAIFFCMATALGAIAGSFASDFLPSGFLKKSFSILIIGTGLFILAQNFSVR